MRRRSQRCKEAMNWHKKSEKKSDKSLVKETSHAAKAWLKAGRRTAKALKHAGFPRRVYKAHYDEVEGSAKVLMDMVEDLGDDMSNNVEQFFDMVEMHVETTMDEKREEFNAKEAEYEDVLLQLESRYNEATMYTHSAPLTEAAVVIQSSNGWSGFPALLLAFLSGSLFVFVMGHFRFRQRRNASARVPLLLG